MVKYFEKERLFNVSLNKNIIDFHDEHDWYFTGGLVKHTILYGEQCNSEQPGSRISPDNQDFLNSEPIYLDTYDSIMAPYYTNLLQRMNRQNETKDRKTWHLWCLDGGCRRGLII